MRLPNFALRVPRPSFGSLPQVRGRFFLYAAYTLILFLLFLVVNFPDHVIVARMLDGLNLGPLRLDVRATRFAWWKGYEELRNVRLVRTDTDLDMPPLLESRSLYVRPGLSGLLRGEVSSLYLTGVMYNGDVAANWAREDGSGRLTVNLDSLELSRYPYVSRLVEEGQLAGQVSGVFSVESHGPGIAGAEAAGEVSLRNGRMAGARIQGLAVPDLNACTGEAKLGLRGGRLEIQDLVLQCDEAKVTVTGYLIPAARLPDSRLDLRLAADPTTEELKAVAPLIPCSVSGTLAHPRARLCTGRSQTGRRRR